MTSVATNRLKVLEEYGRHVDAEEEAGDPVKIRRFLIKATTRWCLLEKLVNASESH
jgi:hypothetical protein